ncbi:hypothetical protein [Streptomonospora wellingtoniae]|uniref:TPM domain-containing protein n=1 Tax=Streptomonospora wellingtoniae TaxID=3075544 RepID=A0ABU2KTM8_9ACTN|nr:hypothetical protein [Streptomonospora sp. DSM 45055]MDT0302453.1 hypothetical protein [Streptomonospora sp. DSM 45055]
MSARVRAVAMLASLTVLFTPFTAAAAAPEESGTGGSAPTPAEEIAESLADSPVHVDPAYETAFPEAERKRIARRIEQGQLNLYVIVIPLASGDAWDGEPEALLTAVNDRMGPEARHMLAYDQSVDGTLTGTDFGPESTDAAFYGALTSNALHRQDEGASIADRVESAVDAAASEDPAGAYEEAEAAYEPATATGFAGLPPWALWAGIAALVLLPAGGGLLLLRRRRDASPAVPQHAAFDNADRAQLRSLVERGERDLIELGERLSAATGVPQRDLARALDARDAAARVHDRMKDEGPALPEAAGVLVLLDLAEDALAGRGSPRRPCYANPLHGNRTRRAHWREFGGNRTIEVPLCAECAGAVKKRVRPTVLPVEYDGRTVPYYEVPAQQSVWAATGFGALTDDLVDRILAGQHR